MLANDLWTSRVDSFFGAYVVRLFAQAVSFHASPSRLANLVIETRRLSLITTKQNSRVQGK